MGVPAMRILGDPILRERCRAVERFDSGLARLGADLLEAMHHYKGVGVAANQIGAGVRVFVYDDDGVAKWLVNPEIADLDGEETTEEGCLSIPGLYFPTTRARRLVARGQDLEGHRVEFEAEGLLARIMQHETDHLNGMLYIDRLDEATRKEAWRMIREQSLEETGRRSE